MSYKIVKSGKYRERRNFSSIRNTYELKDLLEIQKKSYNWFVETGIKEVFGTLNIDITKLTDKKQQTDYKIKYVSEYIKRWTIISAERSDILEITFIDCMCNAGVYKDGDCCTVIEVLNIFDLNIFGI